MLQTCSYGKGNIPPTKRTYVRAASLLELDMNQARSAVDHKPAVSWNLNDCSAERRDNSFFFYARDLFLLTGFLEWAHARSCMGPSFCSLLSQPAKLDVFFANSTCKTNKKQYREGERVDQKPAPFSWQQEFIRQIILQQEHHGSKAKDQYTLTLSSREKAWNQNQILLSLSLILTVPGCQKKICKVLFVAVNYRGLCSKNTQPQCRTGHWSIQGEDLCGDARSNIRVCVRGCIQLIERVFPRIARSRFKTRHTYVTNHLFECAVTNPSPFLGINAK